MSSRAQRFSSDVTIESFAWGDQEYAPPTMPRASASSAALDTVPDEERLATIEREAFAKGYQQGERAGLEAGSARTEAMLRQLTQTIEELAHLRKAMIRQTEEQMVRLALAMARRVVRREIALDKDFALAMARVALDRLGERTSTTIHLHPDDYAVAAGRKVEDWAGAHVSVVSDPAVTRGGCVVDSDLGMVDGTIEAQFDEIARAVLVHGPSEPDPELTHAG